MLARINGQLLTVCRHCLADVRKQAGVACNCGLLADKLVYVHRQTCRYNFHV